jgi:hypothetical protein
MAPDAASGQKAPRIASFHLDVRLEPKCSAPLDRQQKTNSPTLLYRLLNLALLALSIYDTSRGRLFSNTGRGSSQVLLNAAAAAYANPVLRPNSADSEVLLTLPPGGYTAEIAGADGRTGVAL